MDGVDGGRPHVGAHTSRLPEAGARRPVDRHREHGRLHIRLSPKERRRLDDELKRKGLTVTEWFREQLAASEGERLLRGREFVRMEIEARAVELAEIATAKEADALLFAADRHKGTRAEDLEARHELRRQAQPWLEASAYWASVLTRFRRMRDRLARDPAASSATTPESETRTAPRSSPEADSRRGAGSPWPRP